MPSLEATTTTIAREEARKQRNEPVYRLVTCFEALTGEPISHWDDVQIDHKEATIQVGDVVFRLAPHQVGHGADYTECLFAVKRCFHCEQPMASMIIRSMKQLGEFFLGVKSMQACVPCSIAPQVAGMKGPLGLAPEEEKVPAGVSAHGPYW